MKTESNITATAPRVFHVITTIRRGGAENHLVELIAHQRSRGMTVGVAYLIGEGYWRRHLEALGTEVHDLRLAAYGDPRPVWRLRRVLAGFRPSLVHAHLPPAELYTRLALLGNVVPLLITKHNDEPFYKRAVARPLGRWVARRARRVIAISEAVRRYVTEIDLQLPAEQVTTIRYSIDPAPFLTANGSRLRREWNIPPNALVIGTVARLVPQKSLETLIAGFAQFPDQNARLVIVGRGPLEAQLRRLADDRVIWAGFREDIPSVMAAFDAFALSSTYEGFGLVLLEAMAAARPVVATNVSAIPEIVVTGQTGLLVSPREPAAFAAAFATLADAKLRARLGENGRQRVIAEFSPAAMFARTDAVYAEHLPLSPSPVAAPRIPQLVH